MRRINRAMHARGESEFDAFYVDVFTTAHGNEREDWRYLPRRSLRASSERMAERARDAHRYHNPAFRREQHAEALAWAADDVREWRFLGGFLP